jgi:hypothetical protein
MTAFWTTVLYVCVILVLAIWHIIDPQPEVRYQPMAYYADQGNGKSQFQRNDVMRSKDDCLKRAREKYRSVKRDIIMGEIEQPADGISAPFVYGCEVIRHDGTRTGEVLR